MPQGNRHQLSLVPVVVSRFKCGLSLQRRNSTNCNFYEILQVTERLAFRRMCEPARYASP